MSLSGLPLGYCTNVHPGRSLEEVLAGLDRYTRPVADRIGRRLAAGLWLAAPVVAELAADESGARRLADELGDRDLLCYTLNAFPYGDFHGERVKEQVYLPDWSAPERFDYTLACADILAELLPEGADGSISTVPLGFKHLGRSEDFYPQAIDALLRWATAAGRRFEETGCRIRLAIEPEPLCLLETTDETLAFFEQLFEEAERRGMRDVAGDYLGVCYDVCHQSVEFEDVAESIRRLDKAGIRLNKIHITCAIQLDDPANNIEGRERLASFVEPRYLHQVTARTPGGNVLRHVDLDRNLSGSPPAEWLEAEAWRVHFHVPVDADSLGPLGTTRADLRLALDTVASDIEYSPHLEVETYTWEVLPGSEQLDLVSGLANELNATTELLGELSAN
ncbi:MAG: metabolite traffic protein EboE [Planctomycetota bacterium]|nr:metabolite traffic protein EboE [Planctomycetota bacterium]MEE3364645.1 metabolite traffic protein EboE [Planctomycetota bacterium]